VRLFGMTRMRLMVSLFILLLAFSFVLLLAQMFLKRFACMKALLAAGCVLMLAMSFADIDRVVLKYNLWAYRTERLATLDVDAFRELGDAKVPYLIELSYSEDEKIRVDALDQLYDWREWNMGYGQQFSEYNYTQSQARNAMWTYVAQENCPLHEYTEQLMLKLLEQAIINR